MSSNATAASAEMPVRFSGPPEEWPSPRGLFQGYAAVFVFQIVVLAYYCVRRFVMKPKTIQVRPPPNSTLASDLWSHVSKPESFLMVMGYLAIVWMFRILPDAYYDLESGVNWLHVFAQFVVVDLFTFVDHIIEHEWKYFYGKSHKAHHKWVNPKLYNAFNGSVLDTFSLIVIPLLLTSQICYFVSCWSFMAFGSLYAAQFTLIHCEFRHPWDTLFERIGFGTAEDHNIHHLHFKYNYGHFFMWYDWMYGTYRSPDTVKQFNSYQDFIAAHPELAEEREQAAREAAGLAGKGKPARAKVEAEAEPAAAAPVKANGNGVANGHNGTAHRRSRSRKAD